MRKIFADKILRTLKNFFLINFFKFFPDIFLVSEPKRYFKREREFQIFLFESNIVFTKREELTSKKTGYVFKDSMLVSKEKKFFLINLNSNK